MRTKQKFWVLFLALFWRQFGLITFKLPGAKLQLICSYGIGIDLLKGGS